MKRSVAILCVMAILMMVGGSALAWRPAGWVYHTGDCAYSTGDAEWYYFNAADTQWRVNLVSTAWASELVCRQVDSEPGKCVCACKHTNSL